MAMRKASITLFSMVCLMLITIGLQSVEGSVLFGEPCTTFRDCFNSCGHGAIPFCQNGHCSCDKQEEAMSISPTGAIRKLL
ncbi:hypothetical protein A4A49_29516 [Nicotiana attenuata]|uniref:Defensin-like protein n=1 Tax=Nicotiana attenuata TaxID=49451 RepID=A0A1J6J520_NICAT|nr:hypothetical protein A4A49_29516 [Nicotiana attenuata]